MIVTSNFIEAHKKPPLQALDSCVNCIVKPQFRMLDAVTLIKSCATNTGLLQSDYTSVCAVVDIKPAGFAFVFHTVSQSMQCKSTV